LTDRGSQPSRNLQSGQHSPEVRDSNTHAQSEDLRASAHDQEHGYLDEQSERRFMSESEGHGNGDTWMGQDKVRGGDGSTESGGLYSSDAYEASPTRTQASFDRNDVSGISARTCTTDRSLPSNNASSSLSVGSPPRGASRHASGSGRGDTASRQRVQTSQSAGILSSYVRAHIYAHIHAYTCMILHSGAVPAHVFSAPSECMQALSPHMRLRVSSFCAEYAHERCVCLQIWRSDATLVDCLSGVSCVYVHRASSICAFKQFSE
jgi:hypothetical protein